VGVGGGQLPPDLHRLLDYRQGVVGMAQLRESDAEVGQRGGQAALPASIIVGARQTRLDTCALALNGPSADTVATTALNGPTMTAPFGPTWRQRDGSMWSRFRRHREEKARSGVGPSQADIPFSTIGVGPLQGVMVGPTSRIELPNRLDAPPNCKNSKSFALQRGLSR